MQIVSTGVNLHEISNPVFFGKIINMSSELSQRVVKVKRTVHIEANFQILANLGGVCKVVRYSTVRVQIQQNRVGYFRFMLVLVLILVFSLFFFFLQLFCIFYIILLEFSFVFSLFLVLYLFFVFFYSCSCLYFCIVFILVLAFIFVFSLFFIIYTWSCTYSCIFFIHGLLLGRAMQKMCDFYVKRATRFSVRDKRLFEISEVDMEI